METILKALYEAGLYCNPKKIHLFEAEINFFGYYVFSCGIKTDGQKVEWIVVRTTWLCP
jgi:hypothetical protein